MQKKDPSLLEKKAAITKVYLNWKSLGLPCRKKWKFRQETSLSYSKPTQGCENLNNICAVKIRVG